MLAPISFGQTTYKALAAEGKLNPRLACYCCGSLFCKGAKPTVDHLIPVSHRPRGRRAVNNSDYLALMCQPCNLAKSNKTFLEFAAEHPQVAVGLASQAKVLARIPWLKDVAKQMVGFAEKARLVGRG